MNVNCTDNVIFSFRVRADVDYANIDSKTLSFTVNIRTINFVANRADYVLKHEFRLFVKGKHPLFRLVSVREKKAEMKEFGNNTYKKLQKIFANNKDDMVQLLDSYESLTTSKITLDEFAKGLNFKSPAELDALKLI